MQLQSSNFVHKCTMGGYCLQIKNYAAMQRMSQNIIPRENSAPLTLRWHIFASQQNAHSS